MTKLNLKVVVTTISLVGVAGGVSYSIHAVSGKNNPQAWASTRASSSHTTTHNAIADGERISRHNEILVHCVWRYTRSSRRYRHAVRTLARHRLHACANQNPQGYSVSGEVRSPVR